MDHETLRTLLQEPQYAAAVAELRADLARLPPPDAAAQRALVEKLNALAATFNAQTLSTADDGQTIPLWSVIGGRELDHGDIIVALGHRWEELSIPNPDTKKA